MHDVAASLSVDVLYFVSLCMMSEMFYKCIRRFEDKDDEPNEKEALRTQTKQSL